MSDNNSRTHPGDASDRPGGLILVADDDHITRLVIQNMLQQAGYQADLAGNGLEAISALESKPYDLVVMDCNMPQMDGFAATRHIRNATSGRINNRIPVVALTGLTSESDIRRCLDAGMDACVGKPVEATTLVGTIGQYLGIGAGENTGSRPGGSQGAQPWPNEFLETLIADFMEELPQQVAALQRAAGSGDLDKLQSLAHRLRGPSGILEFSTLSMLSKTLEAAAAAEDLARAKKLAAELVEELDKLANALTA